MKKHQVLLLVFATFFSFEAAHAGTFKFEVSKVGTNAGDNFGCYVTNAGRWNGDASKDCFAVGAPGVNSSKGAVYIYFLQSPGTLQLIATLNPYFSGTGQAFGDGLAYLGDVNGDGRGELIVGAPHAKADTGQVWVMWGGGDDEFVSVSLKGPSAESDFGDELSAVGDITGDGKTDFIVGAPGADKAFVYKYQSGSYTLLRSHSGQVGSNYGRAVAGLGDLDDDGYPDYAVGAPVWDSQTEDSVGRVRIYSGYSGSIIGDITDGERISVVENEPGIPPRFGYAIANIGDWDSDGTQDFVVGAPWTGDPDVGGIAGRLYLYSGDDLSQLTTITDTEQYGYLGYSVAGGFTADCDGMLALIAGQPGIGTLLPSNTIGGFTVRGSTDADTLFQVKGTLKDQDESYALGYDVNVIGDVDGDGNTDISGSGHFTDAGNSNTDEGEVRIYLNKLVLGDVNFDNTVTSGDLIRLGNFVSGTGGIPKPCKAADVDQNGCINSADVTCLTNFLYYSGSMPCSGSTPCSSPYPCTYCDE